MTAFARVQHQGDWGNLTCEVRSINHRFLEMSFYLPEMFRSLEMELREFIRKSIKRGKIECVIRYQTNPQAVGTLVNVNSNLVKELSLATQKIAEVLKNPGLINPFDLLRFPGVLESQEDHLNSLKDPFFNLVKASIADLVLARQREGEELNQLFLQRLHKMKSELLKIRERLPITIEDQRKRLLKRFADAKLELDPSRLEQEMVIFAQKIDVAEEIDRTETHIAEIERVLEQGGVVGRRLDFLLQELNREANTMGSKSVDTIIMHAAVEIKVLIEQIREQVQNVE